MNLTFFNLRKKCGFPLFFSKLHEDSKSVITQKTCSIYKGFYVNQTKQVQDRSGKQISYNSLSTSEKNTKSIFVGKKAIKMSIIKNGKGIIRISLRDMAESLFFHQCYNEQVYDRTLLTTFPHFRKSQNVMFERIVSSIPLLGGEIHPLIDSFIVLGFCHNHK